MKASRTWLFGILAAFVALPLVSYAAYDLIEFQARRAAIDKIIKEADPEDRNPPEQIVDLLAVSLGQNAAAQSARLLMNRLGAAAGPRSDSNLDIRETLWLSLVRLHLSENERRTIFLFLAPTGRSRTGVATTSRELYGRPPSRLSLDEAASLIALTAAPSAENDPALLATLKFVLLTRYVSSPQRK